MRLSFRYLPNFTVSLPFGVSIGLELPTVDPPDQEIIPVTDARLLRVKTLVEQIEEVLGADDLSQAVDRLLALADEFPAIERRDAIDLSHRVASLHSTQQFQSEQSWRARKERLLGEIADVAATYHGRAVFARESHASGFRPVAVENDSALEANSAEGNAAMPVLRQNDEKAMVTCNGLGWQASGRWVLRNVSLELGSGSIVGIVGGNGVGKTTLLRLLVQEFEPSEGSISYPGLGPDDSSPKRIRDRIAYVPQIPISYAGRLDVALRRYAALRGLRGQVLEDEVAFVMERFQLGKLGGAPWQALSGGFRTRFDLAKAVLTSPDLIVLDEPLGPLDVKAERAYLRHLRDLAESRRQACIVLTSQDLDAVSSVADYIVVIKDAGVHFAGTHDDIEHALPKRAYEFAGPLAMDQLSRLLLQLPEAHLQDLGSTQLLTTAPTVTAQQVLAVLMDHGESLTYFKDLSQSPQRLIEETPAS